MWIATGEVGGIIMEALMKANNPLLLIGVWFTLVVSAFAGDYREEIPLTKRVLAQPTKIHGILCRDSVTLYENGKLYRCILQQAQTIRQKPLPDSTVVTFYPDGVVNMVKFPHEAMLKGHLCRGATFNSNGKLYMLDLTRDEEIQGIPCKARSADDSLRWSGPYVEFWSNGKLRTCWLAKDFIANGQTFNRGDLFRFNEKGELEEAIHNGKWMQIKR